MSAVEIALQQQMHTLYCEHHGWLYGWLRRKLGCSHNASDIAHDTFLRIIASRNALLGVREPRAYLATTAKRLVVDQARRHLIETAYLEQLALAAEHMSDSPSPEQILQTLQALEQIEMALDGLSAKARQAFLLHYLDNQTHANIAAQLSVSTKMVQKYLIQALTHCQRPQAN